MWLQRVWNALHQRTEAAAHACSWSEAAVTDTMNQSDSVICMQFYNDFVITTVPSCMILSTAVCERVLTHESKKRKICVSESCCMHAAFRCCKCRMVNQHLDMFCLTLNLA